MVAWPTSTRCSVSWNPSSSCTNPRRQCRRNEGDIPLYVSEPRAMDLMVSVGSATNHWSFFAARSGNVRCRLASPISRRLSATRSRCWYPAVPLVIEDAQIFAYRRRNSGDWREQGSTRVHVQRSLAFSSWKAMRSAIARARAGSMSQSHTASQPLVLPRSHVSGTSRAAASKRISLSQMDRAPLALEDAASSIFAMRSRRMCGTRGNHSAGKSRVRAARQRFASSSWVRPRRFRS